VLEVGALTVNGTAIHAVGVAFAGRCFALGWIARIRDSRALKISASGERGFREAFGITLDAQRSAPLRLAV
jgi:hypothetical protein